MMKQFLFLLSAFSLFPLMGNAQQAGDFVSIDTTLILNREDYAFEQQEDGTTKIVPTKQVFSIGYGDYAQRSPEPDAAIPFYGITLKVGKNEAFQSIDIYTTETLDAEDFSITVSVPDDVVVPTGAVAIMAREQGEAPCNRNIYPEKQAYFLYQYLENLVLLVYPFRYDAAGKKLYFCKEIKLHITLKATDGTGIAPSTIASKKSSPIYDMSGRHITTLPARGLIIQNGGKYVR